MLSSVCVFVCVHPSFQSLIQSFGCDFSSVFGNRKICSVLTFVKWENKLGYVCHKMTNFPEINLKIPT